jgi:hypothetical protein
MQIRWLLTLVVWAYCGWTAGAFVSFVFAASAAFGPTLGIGLGLIWIVRTRGHLLRE